MKSRNFVASLVNITAPSSADTEFSVLHELGQVPTSGFVAARASNATLYKSTTAWTVTTAYLKSNAANAAFIVLFFR